MDNHQKRNLTFFTIGLIFMLSGIEYGKFIMTALWTCRHEIMFSLEQTGIKICLVFWLCSRITEAMASDLIQIYFSVGKQACHLQISLLVFHTQPPSFVSDGLSCHPAYNMELSADLEGPSVLPGFGSVCFQSDRAAHRPAFWVLVRPQQNYKIHPSFL